MENKQVTSQGNNLPKRTFGNNYARQRNSTKFDTYELAKQLKLEVTSYVMNDKRVSKRWRYIEGKSTVECAKKIRRYIRRANAEQVGSDKRIKYQLKALDWCAELQDQLDDIINECSGATHENMKRVSNILDELISKIINWRKSDKER